MITFFVSAFLLLGAGFAVIAALGVLRLPDVYCRMHAATKAGAFGVSLILVALIIAAPTLRVFIQSLLIIVFFYLTAPIGVQMIGRAALLHGVPLWRGHEKKEEEGQTR